MRCVQFFLLFTFFGTILKAQHQDVFPGLTGDELLENLVDAYKSNIPLGQASARDTLFGVVYNQNDSLTCVYTGYTIWLDPAGDPTVEAFSEGINTEHTYPKSNGAAGLGEGDMHHLYPTREDVNGDRGNLPFAEIPDNETQSWYYLGQEQSSIPSSNIDLYSERKAGFFEPPEAHKGNVARAMMYFYTMYQEEADLANPTFFEIQRQTLCEWHFLDPVDQAEWDRTWKIAEYQNGKPNPFVLDCTLPERSYCGDFGQNCTPVATSEVDGDILFSLNKITPNPMREGAVFQYSTGRTGDVALEILDLKGVKLYSAGIGRQTAGEHSFYWKNERGISPGLVVCRLILRVNGREMAVSKKAVIH